MTRLASFVLRHRRSIMIGWLVIFLAGGVASGKIGGRLKLDFSLPGQPGQEAANAVKHAYGVETTIAPVIPVITLAPGQLVTDHQVQLGRAFAAIRRSNPRLRVIDYPATSDSSLITNGGRSTYALVYQPLPRGPAAPFVGKTVEETLRAAIPPGASVEVTGLDALRLNGGTNRGPSLFLEVLFGGVGALAVLAFVFASLLAFIPIVVAAVSILTTYLLLLGMTYVTDVNFIVQFLVGLIGLGVAIDYSLLVVTRWREERDHGRDNHDAVVAAVATAGHAVVFSAGTVAIGLCALAVLPVPFLRSIGIGGLLIPLVSMVVTLTLLPAILGGVGPRVDWPKIRHEDTASKAWTRWAALVVRRRWVAVSVAVAALVVMIVPFLGIRVGVPRSDSLASKGTAFEALQTLEHGGTGTGILTPINVLVRGGNPAAFARAASSVAGIRTVLVPTAPEWYAGGDHFIVVVPEQETVAGSSTAVVSRVRRALSGLPGFGGVSGIGANQIDFIHAVYGNFPYLFGIILVLTFVLLARAFRSVLLPLKAVLLNVVSLAATYGIVVFFWQYGHGSQSVFGIAATGAITFWIPMLIFAFLFGLSMDYEVFILSRMREEYDRSGSTDVAVVQGIGRTGRLVTSAALVLFLAFVSLASGPQTDVKVMATALGAGILLDATIIRALLVPALVSLFGNWNWWLPGWLATLLRVKPSHSFSPGLSQAAVAD